MVPVQKLHEVSDIHSGGDSTLERGFPDRETENKTEYQSVREKKNSGHMGAYGA